MCALSLIPVAMAMTIVYMVTHKILRDVSTTSRAEITKDMSVDRVLVNFWSPHSIETRSIGPCVCVQTSNMYGRNQTCCTPELMLGHSRETGLVPPYSSKDVSRLNIGIRIVTDK